MFPVLQSTRLNSEMTRLVIGARDIARKARPGQFVILRAGKKSERIPLTVSATDKERGAITVIFQTVGASTAELASLRTGDAVRDVCGPLGRPTDFGDARRICVVGGGLGCAIALPQVKHLSELGRDVDAIVGFRNEGLIILEDEFASTADTLTIMTDDGSNGRRGFVTDALEEAIGNGAAYDLVVAIGPPAMMRAVCALTAAAHVATTVSLDPIMVDGTGMCGCCRVKVGGAYRHACVDGPDFDGHLVDWDELMARNAMYFAEEARARTYHGVPMKGAQSDGDEGDVRGGEAYEEDIDVGRARSGGACGAGGHAGGVLGGDGCEGAGGTS